MHYSTVLVTGIVVVLGLHGQILGGNKGVWFLNRFFKKWEIATNFGYEAKFSLFSQ